VSFLLIVPAIALHFFVLHFFSSRQWFQLILTPFTRHAIPLFFTSWSLLPSRLWLRSLSWTCFEHLHVIVYSSDCGFCQFLFSPLCVPPPPPPPHVLFPSSTPPVCIPHFLTFSGWSLMLSPCLVPPCQLPFFVPLSSVRSPGCFLFKAFPIARFFSRSGHPLFSRVPSLPPSRFMPI